MNRRISIADRDQYPCFQALLLPFGAPGDFPPCRRHLPFGIAGDWQAMPERVRAKQRGAARRFFGSIRLILGFRKQPSPLLGVVVDIADDGLATGVDVHRRDKHAEIARFRIVTLRQPARALKPLTFAFGAEARAADTQEMTALAADIAQRFPQAQSPKGNGCSYWLEH